MEAREEAELKLLLSQIAFYESPELHEKLQCHMTFSVSIYLTSNLNTPGDNCETE